MSCLLNEDAAACLQSGLSISIASRDANDRPSLAKDFLRIGKPGRGRIRLRVGRPSKLMNVA